MTPIGGDIMDADMYNKFFTLHGAIMVFMFGVLYHTMEEIHP